MAKKKFINIKNIRQAGETINNLSTRVSATKDVAFNALLKEDGKNLFSHSQEQSGKVYRYVKDYIKNVATTPTGEQRKAQGLGPAGRYDEGDLYKTFKMSRGGGDTGKGKYAYQVRIGYLDGVMSYFWAQEKGTRNGIKGMKSLEELNNAMYSWFDQSLAKDKEELARAVANDIRYLFSHKGGRRFFRIQRAKGSKWSEEYDN